MDFYHHQINEILSAHYLLLEVDLFVCVWYWLGNGAGGRW